MPLGWRVHRKVEQIIREEMDAIGGAGDAHAGAHAGSTCGRRPAASAIPEIFHVTDRNGREFVLPMTHEETVTFHAREIQSYKQLAAALVPLLDEGPRRAAAARRAPPRTRVHHEGRLLVRPRRGRACARASRRTARRTRGSSTRCGIEDVRRPGRERDHGRQAQRRLPRAVGLGREHARNLRERRLRGRPGDRARGAARPEFPAPLDAPEEIETPGVTTIEALAEFLSIDASARRRRRCRSCGRTARSCSRSSAVTTGSASRSSSTRFTAAHGPRPTRRSRRGSAPAAARSDRSASPARSSPTRRCARASSSPARTATAGICAGSRPGETTSPGSPTSASRARATRCPNCGGALRFRTAIEVGHIFDFGSFYSEPLGATFLDEDGQREAAARRQLRDRPGTRHGRRDRAAPRRERDRLAARRSHRTTCTSSRCRASRSRPRRRRACSTRPAPTCSSTTATSGRGRSSPTPT